MVIKIITKRKESGNMDNSKICTHCGAVNKIESHFCINCGSQLAQNNTPFNTQPINNNIIISNEEKIGNRLGIISLLLYFVGSIIITFLSFFLPPGLNSAFSALSGFCPLAGLVVMIVGRIKYPNNKFLKITMWIIIICMILSLLAFIFIFIMCYISCSSLAPAGKI